MCACAWILSWKLAIFESESEQSASIRSSSANFFTSLLLLRFTLRLRVLFEDTVGGIRCCPGGGNVLAVVVRLAVFVSPLALPCAEMGVVFVVIGGVFIGTGAGFFEALLLLLLEL